MIIEGKKLQAGKIVENTVWEGQFQPAGVDLSAKEIFEFEAEGSIDGDNSKRKLPGGKKIEWGQEGSLKLMPGAYKVIFNEIVSIPMDAAAIARSRSTLLRCGAAMQTAVWDPGYKGRSEALLIVSNKHGLVVHKDAKLAQLVFIRLEGKVKEGYAGKYQNENI